MLLNSVVVEPGGAGCACVHLAIASAELQRRILVPPALLRTRPIGTRRPAPLGMALRSAAPVNHAVAEKPGLQNLWEESSSAARKERARTFY